MIPTWLQAVLLGIVQGLTELVPVSSSGHLVLVPYLAGWEPPGLAFDVALHLGTTVAIVVYFWRELLAMARGVLRGGDTPDGRLYRRVAGLLVLGSVPVAIVGLALKDTFEAAFATPAVAAAFLLVTAGILAAGEAWRARRVRRAQVGVAAGGSVAGSGASVAGPAGGSGGGAASGSAHGRLPVGVDAADPRGVTLDGTRARHALAIGLAQCLALFPGVSRSGTTIMAGVGAGLTREAATRFSFLLALPALVGAAALSLPDLAEPGIYAGWEIAAGMVAAAVSSYAAIRFLIAFVSRRPLTVFAAYCALAGAIGLGVSLAGA